MLSDRDIYASANAMIRRFGEAVKFEAAQRADERLEAGDLEGQAVWMRIIKTIEILQSTEMPVGTAVH